MEKYSVLLVDDEEDVIQIIMKKMDWESMGFQIAGYAHKWCGGSGDGGGTAAGCGNDGY